MVRMADRKEAIRLALSEALYALSELAKSHPWIIIIVDLGGFI